MDQERLTKRQVHYREAESTKRCRNCVMFHTDGTCDLVIGNIKPEDTCDRWEARVTKQEDLDMTALRLPKMRAEMIDLLDKMELLEAARDQGPAIGQVQQRIWQLRREAYPVLVKLFDAGADNFRPSEFGWNVEQLVSDSLRQWLCKSAETSSLESTAQPLGPNGLWHTPSKKHPLKEKLPNYIEHIAHALIRDQGMEESKAISYAINAVKRWAEGNLHWGSGKVTPEVQAASKRALAEWEKLKEEHHG